ncbi:MAG TPA: DUF3276 family protein [Tepidisphaeraceae bacterium]|jgi:hypothetical protein
MAQAVARRGDVAGRTGIRPPELQKPGFRNPASGGLRSDRSNPAGTVAGAASKPEPEILFQKYFKSVGPRTYAAQLKKAGNGNHFLVLTEGKRDEKTAEIRKTKLFVFSEDFVAFFRMLHETAQFIRDNPVPDEIRQKRERYWAKHPAEAKTPSQFSQRPTTTRRTTPTPAPRLGKPQGAR